jgi:N-acetylneuraminic acid mutarotase
LIDGRVLLVGGSRGVDDFLDDVDIVDPTTGQTSPAAPLHRPRHAHSATLLQDGRVLVVGGYALPWGWLDDAEVYDPVGNTWTVVTPRYSHGVTHTATLLRDGRVLVVGGNIGSSLHTQRVEIFDPQTNTWREAPSLGGERTNHTAQLLGDGRVLVAGGQTDENGLEGGDAVLYDPQTGAWSATGPMVKPRIMAQSARLSDGRVLVAGGMALEDMPANRFTASAELFDPGSNTWSAASAMSQPRYSHFLVPFANGQVVVFGGARDWECCWTESSFVREIESYDPETNTWRPVGVLPLPRAQAAALLLADGCAWLSGGRWSYTTHAADSWLICAR